MRKYDVNQANDLRNRLHISWLPCFFRKISPDAVEIASRRSIGCVPTQGKMHPDVVQDTSGRNFRSILVTIR